MALKLNKKNKSVKKVVKKVIATPKAANSRLSGAANKQITLPTGKYVEAVGRRKVATARVRLYESQGDFVVNEKIIGQYFSTTLNSSMRYMRPFDLTGTRGKFSLSAIVSGSGPAAQLEAVIHGISRALVKYNPEFRALLKPEGLLTRDDRMKETRKIGTGGKARRKRQSPKR